MRFVPFQAYACHANYHAVSGRSFSTLRRVKTYLRSTTGEATFNNIMLLLTHKELANLVGMVEIANLFVEDN